jgi:hypothetical protein
MEVKYPDEYGRPLLQSRIADHVWRIKDKDPEEFKARVKAYFALAYPGWRVVRAQYPAIFLQEERRQEK